MQHQNSVNELVQFYRNKLRVKLSACDLDELESPQTQEKNAALIPSAASLLRQKQSAIQAKMDEIMLDCTDTEDNLSIVARLTHGRCVQSFVGAEKRSINVRLIASDDTHLLTLQEGAYTQLLQETPQIKHQAQLRQLLSQLPWLRNWHEKIDILELQFAQRRVLRRGEVIFSEGDTEIETIYIVQEGLVELSKNVTENMVSSAHNSSSTEQLPADSISQKNRDNSLIKAKISVIGEGAYFGEGEIIQKSARRRCTATAVLKDTIVHVLPATHFLKVLCRDIEVWKFFCNSVSLRQKFDGTQVQRAKRLQLRDKRSFSVAAEQVKFSTSQQQQQRESSLTPQADTSAFSQQEAVAERELLVRHDHALFGNSQRLRDKLKIVLHGQRVTPKLQTNNKEIVIAPARTQIEKHSIGIIPNTKIKRPQTNEYQKTAVLSINTPKKQRFENLNISLNNNEVEQASYRSNMLTQSQTAIQASVMSVNKAQSCYVAYDSKQVCVVSRGGSGTATPVMKNSQQYKTLDVFSTARNQSILLPSSLHNSPRQSAEQIDAKATIVTARQKSNKKSLQAEKLYKRLQMLRRRENPYQLISSRLKDCNRFDIDAPAAVPAEAQLSRKWEEFDSEFLHKQYNISFKHQPDSHCVCLHCREGFLQAKTFYNKIMRNRSNCTTTSKRQQGFDASESGIIQKKRKIVYANGHLIKAGYY